MSKVPKVHGVHKVQRQKIIDKEIFCSEFERFLNLIKFLRFMVFLRFKDRNIKIDKYFL